MDFSSALRFSVAGMKHILDEKEKDIGCQLSEQLLEDVFAMMIIKYTGPLYTHEIYVPR